MLLKTISLSILVLSLVACFDSETPPQAKTSDSAKPAARAPAKPNATPAPLNALEKAKGVEGVVDKQAEDTKKAEEENK